MSRIAPSPPTPKTGRVRDPKYMGYIAALGGEQGAGCVVCGAKPCHVAHYRGGEPCNSVLCEDGLYEKPSPWGTEYETCPHCLGKGWRYSKAPAIKSDRFTLPLCPECHLNGPEAQHGTNERLWWAARQIDPLKLCHELQAIYDTNPLPVALEKGTALILEIRND